MVKLIIALIATSRRCWFGVLSGFARMKFIRGAVDTLKFLPIKSEVSISVAITVLGPTPSAAGGKPARGQAGGPRPDQIGGPFSSVKLR